MIINLCGLALSNHACNGTMERWLLYEYRLKSKSSGGAFNDTRSYSKVETDNKTWGMGQI